jgi:histone-binding protein RBBP4
MDEGKGRFRDSLVRRALEQPSLTEKDECFLTLAVKRALKWHSHTIQWVTSFGTPVGQDKMFEKVIIGTNSEETNYLLITNVQSPDYNPLSKELVDWNITIDKKINHDGEVNKAIYMPQNPCIIATQTSYGEVLVFDYTKQPSEPDPNGKCSPELTLRGHKEEGYGLSWSPILNGKLLSASEDDIICLWDINSMSKGGVIYAINAFREHRAIVNDVAWHPSAENIFGSVGDDRKLMLWDTRSNNASNIVHAHASDVHCLAFNPHHEFILATGSLDESIALWDIRNFKYKLYSLEAHKDAIFQLQWSPHNENILASSGEDGRLYVFDVSKLVLERCAESSESVSPDVLFEICKHTGEISEFSWNPNEPFVLCSVTEDGIVHIWQMDN